MYSVFLDPIPGCRLNPSEAELNSAGKVADGRLQCCRLIPQAAVMRSLRTAPPLPLVFLLMTAGAFGTEWSLKYNQQEICALKGSTVFMNGTFTHPEHLTVKQTSWFIDPVEDVEPTDLCKDPDYSGRVEFFTDEQKHFSLKLSDVMKKDEHQFCFRIKTNEEKERWAGVPGVRELHVEAPEEVTEGETADLTCKTTCSLTDPFIWYKNGHTLTTKTIKNNQLHLQMDDVLYTNVTHRPVQTAASIDSGAGDGQYDTVWIQNEPQYASVIFNHQTAAAGSPTQNVEDPSVIYSTVRKD
ncbi:hypothetical protein SRHO_G00179170 [Serrasalmus rhombeus]